MLIRSEDAMGEKNVIKVTSSVFISSSPAHFVLVHGIGGGAWCWYKVRCLLESSGYKVTCLDLKSAGIDQSNPDSILSFEEYNKPLIDFLSDLPQDQKVILVGHSAGGMSVTDAIHRFAKKIAVAIYVGATMLRSGFRTDQDVKDGVPELFKTGDMCELRYGLGPDQPPTSIVIKKEFQHRMAYHMSPQEPGPLQALRGAKFGEGGGQGVDQVRRVYIKTMHDRILKPEQQEVMIQRWPPSNVFVLESDHSPFFSAPFMLFNLLLKAASSADCI
ncbi:PREDICTED: methylesterase 17-like isoform X2 [Nelumbo nucifera]|uniref:Methylesterase 17-like isoform X2 n=1 Tax=Nelumbo nucifera TaxID=4432 RepID=A0A1U8Q1I0_NELNU|nr:PREDICTED: methylesterase 17-like isoform X2 [Nelumbo nucifera]